MYATIRRMRQSGVLRYTDICAYVSKFNEDLAPAYQTTQRCTIIFVRVFVTPLDQFLQVDLQFSVSQLAEIGKPIKVDTNQKGPKISMIFGPFFNSIILFTTEQSSYCTYEFFMTGTQDRYQAADPLALAENPSPLSVRYPQQKLG